jgi:hypothetical protein
MTKDREDHLIQALDKNLPLRLGITLRDYPPPTFSLCKLSFVKWRRRESNPRHAPCKDAALPTELQPHVYGISKCTTRQYGCQAVLTIGTNLVS